MLESDHQLRQEKLFNGSRDPQYRVVAKLTIPSHFATSVQCSINQWSDSNIRFPSQLAS